MISASHFSGKDKQFMEIALKEAEKALKKGNYPIGAVLVIDGKLVAKARNNILKKVDWISHAETLLLTQNSHKIKLARRVNKQVELFITLEPCLMCFGTAIHHRLTRLVFACPDPTVGATKLKTGHVPQWYHSHWPQIESGLLKEKSCHLIHQFLLDKKSIHLQPWKKEMLAFFNTLHKK